MSIAMRTTLSVQTRLGVFTQACKLETKEWLETLGRETKALARVAVCLRGLVAACQLVLAAELLLALAVGCPPAQGVACLVGLVGAYPRVPEVGCLPVLAEGFPQGRVAAFLLGQVVVSLQVRAAECLLAQSPIEAIFRLGRCLSKS